MKNTIALIAIAGIATAATAGQDTYSLSIAGAAASVDATSGATITIDIIGDSSIGTVDAWRCFRHVIRWQTAWSLNMTWTVSCTGHRFNQGTGVYDGNGNHEEGNLRPARSFSQFFPAGEGSDLGLVNR